MLKGSTGPKGGLVPKGKKEKTDPIALGMIGEAFVKVHGMQAKVDALQKFHEGNGKETLPVRIDRMERMLDRYLEERAKEGDHTRRELALAAGLIFSLIMQLLGS